MDAVDRAEIIIEEDMEDMIAGVKSALRQNNYTGRCQTCGEVIAAARQAALPGCVRCVVCQGDLEERV